MQRLIAFLEPILRDYRWYRRRMGGHWEHWLVDNGGAYWLRTPLCTQAYGIRPFSDARGTPECEDYGTPTEVCR